MKHIKTFESFSPVNEEENWFSSKPLTDDEINKYLLSHPARKSY